MIRRLLALAMLGIALMVCPAAPAAAAAPICPFGTGPAGLRAEAYCAAQLSLGSTIARSLGLLEARMSAGNGRFAVDLRQAQDLRSEREALAASERSARAESGEAAKARIRRVVDRSAAVDAALLQVEARIAREHPQWLELARPAPIGEAATRQLLRPGETLIFWSSTDQATFVWALDRQGADWARLPIGAKALAARVSALRAGLGVDGPGRAAIAQQAARPSFDRDSAAALYQLLFPSAVGARVAGARTLLLVPTGALTSLPFAALPTGRAPDAWLGLQKALAVLPAPNSLRVLRSRPARSAPEPFAGFGAPVLGAAGAGPAPLQVLRGGIADPAGIRALPGLPNAETELHQLARVLGAPPASVHVGAAATERAVRQMDLSRYRILAFATHGLLPGEADGLDEGGLVFTPPAHADDQDDGVLTASEAAQLRLSADWVILSACSTAAGGRPGSEALSGLASAFTYAGARALLVSQWKVDDEAARRLTTLTLAARGLGRAEALRRAMTAIAADRTRSTWSDPSIWAVFELVGDPR